jgi:hypothetical protein
MQRIVTMFFLIAIAFIANAQSQGDSLRLLAADSNIIQDKRVNELVLKHVLVNEARKETMKGYRVQIHFGPEKAKALEVKTKFSAQYNTPAYLDYQQPYFKIRVGDFRTKLEAYKLQQEIIYDFPGAFIVADDIELPKIE